MFSTNQREAALTRGNDLGHALARRQEHQELPKVGEHAEVEEEYQDEVEEGANAQLEPCIDNITGDISVVCPACTR